eukprot:c10345_g1_i1 orf=184-366(-)
MRACRPLPKIGKHMQVWYSCEDSFLSENGNSLEGRSLTVWSCGHLSFQEEMASAEKYRRF